MGAVPHRRLPQTIADRATASIAPPASAQAARRSACASWPRCAAVRCRHQCTPPRGWQGREVRRRRTGHRRRTRRQRPRRWRACSAIACAASTSDGPDVTMKRRDVAPREFHDERRKGIGRPAAKRVAGADVQDDERVRAALTPAVASRARRARSPPVSSISTPSRAGSPASMPSGASRSHCLRTECLGPRSAGRGTTCVYIHVRPRVVYPIRVGAPLAHVNQALRGPPCRSMAMSNRSRLRRRAKAMSSRTRASPCRSGTTSTSSRLGLPRTTGSASGSTT